MGLVRHATKISKHGALTGGHREKDKSGQKRLIKQGALIRDCRCRDKSGHRKESKQMSKQVMVVHLELTTL
jgi:hypothetical protein